MQQVPQKEECMIDPRRDEALIKIIELLKLDDGTLVTFEAGKAATNLLNSLSDEQIGVCRLYATPDGGITFEWKEAIPFNIEPFPGLHEVVEIEVMPDGRLEFYNGGIVNDCK